MRLAVIRQDYTPYAGAERFLESALEALLERNVAISVYTREWPQTRLQLIEAVICDPFYVGQLWRDAGFARAVGRVIGDAKANLVQSHELLVSCDIYRPRAGVYAVRYEEELRGAGVFARARLALDPYRRYALETERRLFASPWLRAVLCGSRMVRDEIRERYGLPDDRLHVVYNAVDADAFHPGVKAGRAGTRQRVGIAADATVFLHISSDFAFTGVAEAIAAIAELPAPAHLIIVGRDRRRLRYKALARTLGVTERVTFISAAAEIRAWYGTADAYVLPTLYDPAPATAFEAMACGLPVITSTKSGAAELLLERDGGLVCPARDVPGLAAQMRALLDPDTRERLGANARRAVEPLSPAAMTLKLVLLYRDLLAATVPARPGTRPEEPETEGEPSGASALTEAPPTAVPPTAAPPTLAPPTLAPPVPAAMPAPVADAAPPTAATSAAQAASAAAPAPAADGDAAAPRQ
jgi:UDP-glucose:(heptosyl)LPS alpha-1,3-glucosyltransferase